MNAFHSTYLFCCFSRYQAPANSVAPPSVYKPHTTHNSSIRSDEGLTLETSAFESLYGGKFMLSTQLIKPNYLVILPPTQDHSFFRNWTPLIFMLPFFPSEKKERLSSYCVFFLLMHSNLALRPSKAGNETFSLSCVKQQCSNASWKVILCVAPPVLQAAATCRTKKNSWLLRPIWKWNVIIAVNFPI